MGINLGNLLSDIDFWGGVASGVEEELDTQDARKNKEIDRFADWGLNTGLRIQEENYEALSENGKIVEQIAGQLAGSGSSRSKEAKEATLFLINKYGVNEAATRAKDLAKQYNTYGREPIAWLGLEPRSSDEVVTTKDIARTFTKLRPMPSLKDSGLPASGNVLDKIFDRDSAADIASQQISGMFDVGDQTDDLLTPVSGEDPSKKMILGDNFSDELKRMYSLDVILSKTPEAEKDANWQNEAKLIANNIDILKQAQAAAKTPSLITEIQVQSYMPKMGNILLGAAGLKGEYDVGGKYISNGTQAEITKRATEASAKYAELWQKSNNSGYVAKYKNADGEIEIMNPTTFITLMAGQGKHVVLNMGDPENGIDPYLEMGDDVFDRSSQAFQNSLSGVTPVTPIPGNNPPASTQQQGTPKQIRDDKITTIKSTLKNLPGGGSSQNQQNAINNVAGLLMGPPDNMNSIDAMNQAKMILGIP